MLKAADFRIADTLAGVTAVPTPQATSHWHHFIPKRQIRRWAHDRVDDPDRALVHLRPKRGGDVRPVSVRKAFAQADHHLIRMLDGTDSSWIDQQLLQPLEGTVSGVISSLVDGSETLISIGVDRKNIALFVNLLHQAVPAKAERRAQDALTDPAESAAFAHWMAGHTGAPSDPRAPREFAMGRALQVVLGSGQAAAIAERAWQLFSVPATVAETLILGDVPVLEVQFPASDGRDRGRRRGGEPSDLGAGAARRPSAGTSGPRSRSARPRGRAAASDPWRPGSRSPGSLRDVNPWAS